MRTCLCALAVVAIVAVFLPVKADEFMLDTCIVYAPSLA
jgi:hypothetical protein